MIYDNLKKNKNNIVEVKNKVIIHFVKGPYVEIKGNVDSEYTVKFIDNKTGKVHYSTNIKNNCWCKCSIEYFVEWKIVIYQNDKIWYEYVYNAKGKRVYIAMDSKALGDSLAWVSYVEEFRKQHECEVITSTFMNHMFEQRYPNVKFIEPGKAVENLYAMYCVGLFYNDDNTV